MSPKRRTSGDNDSPTTSSPAKKAKVDAEFDVEGEDRDNTPTVASAKEDSEQNDHYDDEERDTPELDTEEDDEDSEQQENEDDEGYWSPDLDAYDNDFGVDPQLLMDYFDGRVPSQEEVNRAARDLIEEEIQNMDMGMSYDDGEDVREPTPEPIPRNEIKCKCGKPVLIRVAGPNSKPENVGKEYATCKTNSCNYWALVEFAHIKCRCGNPARICITKNGMEHNIGREFGVCAEKKCGFWMWADGGRPFGQKSQELFNEHMDAWVNSID